MEQLAWLPAHPDLAVAITAARREADPSAALAKAVRFAGYRRDFTATGRIVGGGRSLLFLAGELVHEDGTLIATASATLMTLISVCISRLRAFWKPDSAWRMFEP